MATFYTDITSSADQLDAHDRFSSLVAAGELQVARPIYTLTSGTDETASDFIDLVKLPIGAVLLPLLSSVAHDDVGTALTFDIGDADDPNRYALAITCGTNAGNRDFVADGDVTLPAAVTAPYTIATEANRLIKADLTTVTAPTAGQKLYFNIVYAARR